MMRGIGNEWEARYGKSYEAQGRYVVVNGVSYFNQISYDIDLHDNNYHLMVNLLIKLMCGGKNLRVEAPEWYPTMEAIGHDSRNIVKMNESKACDVNSDEKDFQK